MSSNNKLTHCKYKYIPESKLLECNKCHKYCKIGSMYKHTMMCYNERTSGSVDYSSLFTIPSADAPDIVKCKYCSFTGYIDLISVHVPQCHSLRHIKFSTSYIRRKRKLETTVNFKPTTECFGKRDSNGLYKCKICKKKYKKGSLRYHKLLHEANKINATTNSATVPAEDLSLSQKLLPSNSHTTTNDSADQNFKFKYIPVSHSIQCYKCKRMVLLESRFKHSACCYNSTKTCSVDYSSLFIRTSEDLDAWSCKKCNRVIQFGSIKHHVFRCFPEISFHNKDKGANTQKCKPISNSTKLFKSTKRCFEPPDSNGFWKCKLCGKKYKGSSRSYHKMLHTVNELPVVSNEFQQTLPIRVQTRREPFIPQYPCCSCPLKTADHLDLVAHFQSNAHPHIIHADNFQPMDPPPTMPPRNFPPGKQLYRCFLCLYTTTDREVAKVCMEMHCTLTRC